MGDRHYHVQQWPLQGETIPGEKNVVHRALVDKTKIYLPPLHIKLGLIKIFVKAMNRRKRRVHLFKTKMSTHE